jgi:hypothetical protein
MPTQEEVDKYAGEKVASNIKPAAVVFIGQINKVQTLSMGGGRITIDFPSSEMLKVSPLFVVSDKPGVHLMFTVTDYNPAKADYHASPPWELPDPPPPSEVVRP